MTSVYGPLDIPGYRLERLLGSGGFADVYLYTQELLQRPVAVKIMREQVEQGSVRRQFTTEANLMAQLASHPSIVTILSAEISEGGRPYIIMEYCSRPGLAARYKARPLSVAEMLQTMIRLCGAVETAHRAGILHRDIKPANVLTTDYGWPALTDFGISAIVGEGTIGGGGMSVPWSPPEAFTGTMSLDARSDVYSLAATAYTVLAGHSPFDEEGQNLEMGAFVYRILESPVPPIQRSDVPETLQRLLGVAMAKHPENRPPSAASFARALQRIEQELMLPATQLDVPDQLVDDLERTQTQRRESGSWDATTASGDDALASPAGDDRTIARTAEGWTHPELDEETVLLDRPAAAESDDEDSRTVALGTVAPGVVAPGTDDDPPEDATVVVERAEDRTVVVDRAEDRTVVVERGDESTSVIARPAVAGRTTHADVPLRSDRVAYIPDPEAVERYRARRQGAAPEPARLEFAPPPQRSSVDPAEASAQSRRARQRSLIRLVVALTIGGVVVVGAVIALIVGGVLS